MKIPDVNKLLDVGIALSREKDGDTLLETILTAAIDITSCDAGTLYINTGEALRFRVMITKSQGIFSGGRRGEITLPPVPLTRRNVSACAAVENKLINVADVYDCEQYDFSGTRRYDETTGYQSRSMLVVPMENDFGDVIGVLQLINAMDESGATVPFDPGFEQVISSLASQAAICLTSMNYADEITELFDSFVRVMSTAIDQRTPYNANHTRNMVRYAERFIDWINTSDAGWPFDTDRRRQFLMSVWLHDVGKLVTPLEVMDKGSRLGEKHAGVLHRMELARLQNRIDFLSGEVSQQAYDGYKAMLYHARELIDFSNTANFLPDDVLERLRELGRQTYSDGDGGRKPLLMPDELAALMVQYGTLTATERAVMEGHVTMTARMLGQMKFSRKHKDVPVWASLHHELLNGQGYPSGLADGDIPREVRLLTILDVFEALTARDRPYKAGMQAEQALEVLEGMARDGALDTEIVVMFRSSRAWDDSLAL